MKLSDLEKFSLLKSCDNKQTLLMFVIVQAEKNEGKDIVNVNEKIEDYQVLQRIQINQFTLKINELRQQQKLMDKAITSQTANENDKVTEK